MQKNLITTAILLALPSLALAEQSQELSPVTVYSAYAAPINQDKTASSVTVLTEKDFAERNATYVSDVLKTVPGVAIISYGGRGTLTNIYIRGAETNQSIVVIDGVKMNPISGNGFDFGALSLSNIERIEVLRGEQSALWGSDAMGGVVYITTKSGLYKDKAFNVDFDLGTGSKGTYDGSVTVSGQNNGFYYALQGDSHRTRGISALSADRFNYTSESGVARNVNGAVENDKFHSDSASLRLGYDDSNKGIEVLAKHSSQTTHFDGSLAGETSFDDRTRTRENLFKLSAYLGNEQELLKHKFNISRIKTDSDTFGSWVSAYDAKKLNTNYQLDINFDREGDVTQAVSLLAEYQKAKYEGSEYNQQRKTFTDKSLVMEYRLLTAEDHSFALSGRYIDNSMFGDEFTGRISAAYRLSPNFKAHASLGTAVQTPTVSEYFGYAPWTAPNFDLKPEKSLGGDIGLLVESTNKAHSLDVTYFARNVKDLIVYDYYNERQNNNVEGTSQIRGLEIAYNGKLTDNLSVYANYTFARAKDSKNKELLRRPKHSANAGVSYQITEQFGANASLSYVGKRIDDSYNRYKMPSYTLVNLGANYQLTKNLNIYAHLNNVFDKKYENVLGYGQDGRNVYLGLKGSF